MAREGETAVGVQRQMKVIFSERRAATIYRIYTESKNDAGGCSRVSEERKIPRAPIRIRV